MNREHFLLLAAFLGALGLQLGTLEHGWQDATSPAWVGATLMQVGIVLRSFWTEKAGS